MALNIAKRKRNSLKKLYRLASKLNIDITNLNNILSIKMNSKCSSREYLQLKTQQELCRRKYLETTERLEK